MENIKFYIIVNNAIKKLPLYEAMNMINEGKEIFMESNGETSRVKIS